jgi:hypothetical protein
MARLLNASIMLAAPSSISAFLPPDIMLASRRRKSTVSAFSSGGIETAVTDIEAPVGGQ